MEEMVRIADQQNKQLATLSDDLPLLESGLDSLCVAVLVASVNDRTGFDPFDHDGYITLPVTVGDLIKLYENGPV
jgi:acyl carrier protein